MMFFQPERTRNGHEQPASRAATRPWSVRNREPQSTAAGERLSRNLPRGARPADMPEGNFHHLQKTGKQANWQTGQHANWQPRGTAHTAAGLSRDGGKHNIQRWPSPPRGPAAALLHRGFMQCSSKVHFHAAAMALDSRAKKKPVGSCGCVERTIANVHRSGSIHSSVPVAPQWPYVR